MRKISLMSCLILIYSLQIMAGEYRLFDWQESSPRPAAETDPGVDNDESAIPAAAIRAEQIITLSPEWMKAAPDGEESKLIFPLSATESANIMVKAGNQASDPKRRFGESLIRSGAASEDPQSSFTWIQIDDSIFVSMVMPEKQREYTITFSQDNQNYLWREIDTSLLPRKENYCGIKSFELEGEISPSVAEETEAASDTTDNITIKVLLLYTPQTEALATSRGTSVEQSALLYESKMNEVLQNTGLSHITVKVVDVKKVNYNDAGKDYDYHVEALCGYSEISGLITNPVTSGNPPEKDLFNTARTTWREQAGADLVCLMVSKPSGSTIGIAMVGLVPSTTEIITDPRFAYSIVIYPSQADYYYTFAHEIAHSIGCKHGDRQFHPSDSGAGTHAYAKGFGWKDGSVGYHTVMAYYTDNYRNEMPYYSSPSIYVNGKAVGDSTHDNARMIRKNAAAIAAYMADPVTNVAVQSISVNPTSLSLAVGGTGTITATIVPSTATNKSYTWSSNNTSVATVNTSGVVTGKAAGSATITAKTADGGKTATCNVIVTSGTIAVTGLTLVPTKLNLVVDEAYSLKATVAPDNATTKTLTWSSNNESIVTVTSWGRVTAKALGNAIITVKSNDGNKTATGAVTVTDNSQNGLYVWGSNGEGQLGLDNDHTSRSYPTLINGLDNVQSIAAGYYHSLCVANGGKVYAWGCNTYGQLGLDDDGLLPEVTTPTLVPGLSGVKTVVVGGTSEKGFSLSLLQNGSVVSWGNNEDGVLGLGDAIDRYIPTQIPNLSGVTALAAGNHHVLALKTDGTIMVWGSSRTGLGKSTNTPTLLPNFTTVKSIAAGAAHSLILLANGTVMSCGYNAYGSLGFGEINVFYNEFTLIPNLTGVQAIAAGRYNSFAFLNNKIMAWGMNSSGQLGLGDSGEDTDRLVPTIIPGLSDVKALVAGYYHSLFLKNNGSVMACGTSYTLGLGDSSNRTTPTLIPSLQNVTAIAAGYWHSMAIVGGNQTGDVAVTGVTVSPSVLSVNVGSTAKVTANVIPTTATNKTVYWSAQEPYIAAVQPDGTVTGVSKGSTTVQARTEDGNFTATCLVTVTEGYSQRELEVRAFVRRFYQKCLNREPDEGGLSGWANLLLNGTQSGREVGYGFIASPEFTARNLSNTEYLKVLYYAFFNRDPDEGGFNGWLNLLNNGHPRMAKEIGNPPNVYDGFSLSTEFANLCAQYNIKQY